MSEIKLSIDGREVIGTVGQTILDIARHNGIEIPTLCHDDRLEIYGACGLCTVEIEGSPRLFRACATMAAGGMAIKTNTERIIKNRRVALELLLGDHRGDCIAPCTLACPARTDCPGYVKLIAEGEYQKALALIKEKIPFPASIGRICPHPCEEACRRELVEEPVSICALKQFAGDFASGYIPDTGSPTGKNVAIVGGGPGGLSAAYFLRIKGHGATVYEAMPEMGGMLHYGVPEYRLPKKILQKEIEEIKRMGAIFYNDTKIGRDFTLSQLRESYDAVVVAVGAWENTKLNCLGEGLGGVFGAVDFLRDVNKIDKIDKYDFKNRTVAVVGGGDIAMDACRTAVRLGGRVYNIYRRTFGEMPASKTEIEEAKEEGVIFINLANPIEIIGDNGLAKTLRLQLMELGEPDASGRRSPIAVPGMEERLEVDAVIIAIGQKPSGFGFEELEKTKWGTLKSGERTFLTSLDGVFAIGDATNKGADIAVSAIGEAREATEAIDRYLKGEDLAYTPPYLVKDEKAPEDFADREKAPRAKMPQREPGERRGDFMEVNLGLAENEAIREASRCLECGCHAYLDCLLIKYANQYGAGQEKYKSAARRRKKGQVKDFFVLDGDKCILCGLCARICEEVAGETLFGFMNRGFETVVDLFYDGSCKAKCLTCKKCAEACPTGALMVVES